MILDKPFGGKIHFPPTACYSMLTLSSTEAIQIGPPGSSFGALGTWTTIFHDLDDPVGKAVYDTNFPLLRLTL